MYHEYSLGYMKEYLAKTFSHWADWHFILFVVLCLHTFSLIQSHLSIFACVSEWSLSKKFGLCKHIAESLWCILPLISAFDLVLRSLIHFWFYFYIGEKKTSTFTHPIPTASCLGEITPLSTVFLWHLFWELLAWKPLGLCLCPVLF